MEVLLGERVCLVLLVRDLCTKSAHGAGAATCESASKTLWVLASGRGPGGGTLRPGETKERPHALTKSEYVFFHFERANFGAITECYRVGCRFLARLIFAVDVFFLPYLKHIDHFICGSASVS